MYVTFTVIQDGRKTEYAPQLFRQGLMAEMINKASKGARIFNVRTVLSRHA